MEIRFSPHFKRAYKALPSHIQQSFDKQIAVFIKLPRDPRLGAHKLKGQLQECLAFKLADGYRVLFEYADSAVVQLLDVGPHDHYSRW